MAGIFHRVKNSTGSQTKSLKQWLKEGSEPRPASTMTAEEVRSRYIQLLRAWWGI